MISSKRITVIGILLTAAVLILTIGIMIYSSETATNVITGTIDYSENHNITYTNDDFYTNYSENGVAKITLSDIGINTNSSNVTIDGNEVTILGGGTYVLSGTISDGNIVVDSSDSAEVRLILNGVKITSSDFSPLYIKNAKKVVISMVNGTKNTFIDGENYNEAKLTDGSPSACIYSKDDVTINGSGTLVVRGNYNDGIQVNDALKITEGTVKIYAEDDGINVNNYIGFLNANIEINTSDDAIKCEHDSMDYGFIAFEGTTVNVSVPSDGIHASSSVYINDVNANITANEGIEGAYIEINGGNINIISSDDAINAVGENSGGGFMRPMGMRADNISDEIIYLVINGGNIYIETRGDGIDSNGAVVVNGGNIEVYGPENNGNSSLDFEYAFVVNGGTLLAAGSSGMAESPSELSEQNSIVFSIDKNYDAGSEISVTDSNGNEIIKGISGKKFNWICVSSDMIADGGNYTLKINGEDVLNVQTDGVVTMAGSTGRRM